MFEDRARSDGKPVPVPKREMQLMAVLGSKAALMVMAGLLAVVVVIVLVLLAVRV